MRIPQELLWILGETGVRDYEDYNHKLNLPVPQNFPDAGICIVRDRDLYLLFNASDAGIEGRGSHGHNDALSIEVSACGRPFIVDPGTNVYTSSLEERHRFRSTAYHSTVQIDRVEQNATDQQLPFVIGNESRPKVLSWAVGAEQDQVSAEHSGYSHLPKPVTHRRVVTFNKRDRFWLVEDEFAGTGEHLLDIRFHFDTALEVSLLDGGQVVAYDKTIGAKLFVSCLEPGQQPTLEEQFVSRDFGSKQPSTSALWSVRHSVPHKLHWTILPVCPGENEDERLQLVKEQGGERT